VRALQAGSKPSELAKAIAEVGRVAKSLFLLSYDDDEARRRRVLVQLEPDLRCTAIRLRPFPILARHTNNYLTG
jgi:TnpA family transposase